MKSILICTIHKGVFFGQVPQDTDLTQRTLTNIKNARMAIYWGTTKGVMQLAETGPTEKSRIGAPAKIDVLHDIIGIFAVSKEAEKNGNQRKNATYKG